MGANRNTAYGHYTYNLIVTLIDGSQEGFQLFAIDPQIDNIAPPGTPYPGDKDGGEAR
jgi:hypothetical protein